MKTVGEIVFRTKFDRNADLIAAAPALLAENERLRALLDEALPLVDAMDAPQLADMIRAALAGGKGGEVKHATCPTCNEIVRIPDVPVRSTGRLVCSSRHLFDYRAHKETHKETWFGGNGKVFHYHDKHGTPICGSGWFGTGRKALALPEKACKRCVALVTKPRP